MADSPLDFASFADRYTIERELGRGGMATVYLAHDRKYDRLVALKLLRPELAAILGADRFLREIRLTAQLQHPHILPLLDSGDAGGVLYYAMPYVAGESLRQRLTRAGPLAPAEALAILRAIAGALDYAHEAGVVHRDIKPENILLHEGEAMVADFGIALARSAADSDRLTGTGISVGTPAYMSPEQATAEALDRRSDVYSLGCVLYEMLAGTPPFTGPTAQAVIAQSLSAPAPRLPTERRVSQAVDDALARALAKNPDHRFPTAGAFVAALTTPGARARRLSRRALVATALVALVGLGVALRPYLHLGHATALPAVAVLYFDNLSPDTADAYLADGLTEEIIARLGGVTRLDVRSRAAVRRFRAGRGSEDPAAIGRALGVTYLVTGSVRRAGPRARVIVELMQAGSGDRVWGTTFDRAVGDLLDLEDDIAQAVAGGVVGRLAPAERAVLTTRATTNEQAYDHYLQGNWYLARRASETDGRRALAEYQAALRLDSSFASAWGRLGLVYGIYANWPWDYPGLTLDSLFARGLAATARALALDSENVDGLLARGFLLIPHPTDADAQRAFGLDPSLLGVGVELACPTSVGDCAREAVTVLARAIRLAPRDAEVWYQYGRAQHVAARGDPALLASGDTAVAVSLTLEPDSRVSAWLLGLTYLRQRRWDAARAMLDSAIALGRRDPPVFALRFHTRLGQGDLAGARADLDTIGRFLVARSAGDPLVATYLVAMRATVAARGGDSAAARTALRALLTRRPAPLMQSRVERLCLAAAYLAAGERESAVAILERLPSGNWDSDRLDPVWDPVRSDPRLPRRPQSRSGS
ncbi:MAG TPA: protein kinase [Gemmatimonadales bacterium]